MNRIRISQSTLDTLRLQDVPPDAVTDAAEDVRHFAEYPKAEIEDRQRAALRRILDGLGAPIPFP